MTYTLHIMTGDLEDKYASSVGFKGFDSYGLASMIDDLSSHAADNDVKFLIEPETGNDHSQDEPEVEG